MEGTMRLAVVAIILAALAGPTAAMDGAGNFWVVGAGSLRCSSYAQGSPEQKLTMETWVAGYTTAMNRATSNTYNLLTISVDDAKARLDQICQASPDKLFVHAVHELLESLYPNRQLSAPQQ
jgi:hypothetical protein